MRRLNFGKIAEDIHCERFGVWFPDGTCGIFQRSRNHHSHIPEARKWYGSEPLLPHLCDNDECCNVSWSYKTFFILQLFSIFFIQGDIDKKGFYRGLEGAWSKERLKMAERRQFGNNVVKFWWWSAKLSTVVFTWTCNI